MVEKVIKWQSGRVARWQSGKTARYIDPLQPCNFATLQPKDESPW